MGNERAAEQRGRRNRRSIEISLWAQVSLQPITHLAGTTAHADMSQYLPSAMYLHAGMAGWGNLGNQETSRNYRRKGMGKAALVFGLGLGIAQKVGRRTFSAVEVGRRYLDISLWRYLLGQYTIYYRPNVCVGAPFYRWYARKSREVGGR
jgi:hypothetical protein